MRRLLRAWGWTPTAEASALAQRLLDERDLARAQRDDALAELHEHRRGAGCLPTALLAHWHATDAGRSCGGTRCDACQALADWLHTRRETVP